MKAQAQPGRVRAWARQRWAVAPAPLLLAPGHAAHQQLAAPVESRSAGQAWRSKASCDRPGGAVRRRGVAGVLPARHAGRRVPCAPASSSCSRSVAPHRTNSSYTRSCTMNRSAPAQFWPHDWKAPRSAVGSTCRADGEPVGSWLRAAAHPRAQKSGRPSVASACTLRTACQ